MFNKNLLKLLFIILITILIFAVLFTKIGLQKVRAALASVDLGLFMLAVVVSIFSNIFVASDKWRRILKELGCSISFKEALLIVSGSIPIRFILPLKSGELAKAVYLKRRKKLGFEYGVSLAVFDKVSNLLGILIILCIGLIFYGIGLSPVCVLFPMTLWVLPAGGDSGDSTTCVIDRFKKIGEKACNFIKRMNSILGRISYSKRIWLLVYSVFFQSMELITACILFKAAGLSIPLYAILIYIPIVVLLSNIPVTIAGLGTREAAIVFFFFRYGPPELLLTSAILVSFIEHILPMMVGLTFFTPFIKKTFHGHKMTKQDDLEIEQDISHVYT